MCIDRFPIREQEIKVSDRALHIDLHFTLSMKSLERRRSYYIRWYFFCVQGLKRTLKQNSGYFLSFFFPLIRLSIQNACLQLSRQYDEWLYRTLNPSQFTTYFAEQKAAKKSAVQSSSIFSLTGVWIELVGHTYPQRVQNTDKSCLES